MHRDTLKAAFGNNDLSRRDFVERCALAAFGLAVLPMAGALGLESSGVGAALANATGPGFGKAKRVIVLNLEGGLSHIDSFDPKGGAAKGPGETIATKAGFEMTDFFPATAKVAGELTVIRSMSAKVGVHEQAQYLMRTGFEARGTLLHPVLGAWAQHYLGPSHPTLPASVCVNRGAGHGNGFFPANCSPLPIFDPNQGLANTSSRIPQQRQDSRMALMRQLNRDFADKVPADGVHDYGSFYDETLKLMKSDDLKAFHLAEEKDSLRDRYGRTKFGQGCLLARRLTEHGVRFVEVQSGGWDMHKDLADQMADVGADFDRAFAALITDLKERNLLDSTLVAVVTEFGRKPELEGTGRSHHPAAFSTVLAGGGTRRGFVYGATDAKGYAPTEKPVTVGELHATLAHAAGLPLAKEVKTPEGRPMTIGNKAKPVLGVF